MKRVAQRKYESGDCGIACAAMLAGSSYEEAHKKALRLKLRKTNGNYHTKFYQVQALLKALGARNNKQKHSPSWGAIATPAVVKVNQSGNYWHWIVVAETPRGERYILDPEPGVRGRITNFNDYSLDGNHIHVF